MSVYRLAVLLAAACAASLTYGCGRKAPETLAPPATAVEVVAALRGSLTRTMDVTGTIRALQDVTLSAKMGGKVVAVPYREGDRVARGAAVVQQQLSDLTQQVRSAESALASARVRLSQARTASSMQSETTDAALRAARVALTSAREQLAVVKQGARPQERRQAESAVAAARANFENAQTTLARTKQLYEQGAVSRANLDADQRSYDVAKSSLASAEEALSLVRAGARPEEVRITENNVRSAEERLRQAQADLQQKVLRKEDIQAAEAAMRSADANLQMARQAATDASIRTPIAGVVAERNVDPGEMVAPGSPLIRVYNPQTIYYEATISETQMGQVRVGQPAVVTSEALPGRRFRGNVVKIYPAASTSNRSFRARLQVSDPGNDLKPGMFAKAGIEVQRLVNVLTLPADALMKTASGDAAFVVQRGTVKKPAPLKKGEKPKKKAEMITFETTVARKRAVEVGVDSKGVLEIRSGVAEGESVVRGGQQYLRDGQEVQVVSPGEDGTR